MANHIYLATPVALAEGEIAQFLRVDAYGRMEVGGSILEAIRTAVISTAAATVQGNVGYDPSNDDYEVIAAGDTDEPIGDQAPGDYLLHVILTPTSLSPGDVVLKDGATEIQLFDGGASSLTSKAPIQLMLNLTAITGFTCTTGADIKAAFVGQFLA